MRINEQVNLVIDIGNSSVKAAVFDGEALIDTLNAPGSSLAFIDKLTEKYPIKSGILATVVNLDEENRNWLRQQAFAILELNHDTPLPITNLYKTPHTLGYDRIAAVVGAYANSPGKDILVVDAGTAITYEFLDSQGRYHGGNISPGVQMRFKALHQLTNRLPLVSAQGEVPSMGYDTDTAIRAGVLKGIEYEIRGYITSLKHKYPELLVFLTGREEFSFDTTVKNIIFADSFLVLKGLNRILKYNNGRF